MRIFALMPKGIDIAPCRYCANPIADLFQSQCMHDMGTDYAPCQQLFRISQKKRYQRLEIMWVCLATVMVLGVLFLLHNR